MNSGEEEAMVAHIRAHLQFYFFLVSAFSFSVLMRFDDLSKQTLLYFLAALCLLTYQSSYLSIEKKSGLFGVLLAVAHFAVAALFFERYILTVE